MPEHKCKDCGAVWYGWGEGKICQKCGGKLKKISDSEMDNLIKKKDKEESKK